jgi:uncharacterized protein
MVRQELLDLLVCPEDKSDVKLLDEATLARVNAAIAAGSVKNRSGEAVADSIDGGLLRADGQFLYPIRDDIPIMLIDESIPMEQIG